jgi:hypothetical protein
MRFGSLEHYGVNTWRLALVATAAAVICAAGVLLAAGGVLGTAAPGLVLVVGSIAFYLVATVPKRMLETSAMLQSKEAPSLAVMASVDFEATRSRSRTILMMMPVDRELAAEVTGAKRAILLGASPEQAADASAKRLAAYSAGSAVRKAATMTPESIEEGGEESESMAVALRLGEESKLPVFMTACFFTPILLLLYALFSHLESPENLAELAFVQIVVLDVAFHVCSTGNRRVS